MPMVKPRLIYPEGQSPLGKAYVEPDFILRYPNNKYVLVELERPGHRIVTRVGHPSASVTHAAFQIAEWKDYINRFYGEIKEQFPGIAGSYTSMIVIGTGVESSLSGEAQRLQYLNLLRQQFGVEEVLTYTDLLIRARRAFTRLSALAI